MADDNSKKSFETAIAELEALVSRMEKGDMGLDDMLAAFERARSLASYCDEELSRVKQRVEKVVKSASGEASGVEEASFD